MAALPRDDPQRDEVFVMGDINSSLIKTARGRTILLQHDVSTPRPYSRINHVQGTRGAFRGYPDRLALVSVKEGEEWIEDSSLIASSSAARSGAASNVRRRRLAADMGAWIT